ncbi:MAG: response regulator [Prolixibacteraceae bacterium]|nr:response regulator [Prolixibacteraceae bacterium]
MKQILIIEDEEELREGIAEILTYEGYNVLQAVNGAEGLKVVNESTPDLILCDILMPNIDGYEVLSELKNRDEYRLIPFIFLTALNERVNYRRGMELGADDYLTKPFSREELLKAVSSKIDKYSDFEKKLKLKIDEIEDELSYKITCLNVDIDQKEEYINQLSSQNEYLDCKLKQSELKLMQEFFNLVETNNTIQNIKKIISVRLKNAKLTADQKMILMEIKNKIERKKNLFNSWTVFQLRFNQVYPHFISNITSRISGLTQYELIFLSATVMGLSTTQLADLLNISDDSVRKSRYRLKKKLGLNKTDDLLKYIHSFKSTE